MAAYYLTRQQFAVYIVLGENPVCLQVIIMPPYLGHMS